MHARDLLLQRQRELKDSISAVEAELSQIVRALKAMDEVPTAIGQFAVRIAPEPKAALDSRPPKHPMRVNDAIVIAVEAGQKTPTQILAYLKTKLGVDTTLNSVRSRVSPLGQTGLIGHDDSGWIPVTKRAALDGKPQENGALNGKAASAPEAGRVTALPNDSETFGRMFQGT